MAKNKINFTPDYPGVWVQIFIPTELHINTKIEALKDRVSIKEKIVELLQAGFDSKHKTNK